MLLSPTEAKWDSTSDTLFKLKDRCFKTSDLFFDFLLHFYVRICLIVQNWDGQPYSKLHTKQYAIHIYKIVQKQTVPVMYSSVDAILSSNIATDWSASKDGDPPKEIQHPWHHSIGRKHTFLHVKFRSRIHNFSNEKIHAQDKVTFFMGDGPSVFKNAVFEKCWLVRRYEGHRGWLCM